MWTRAFWAATAERVVRGVAVALAGMLGAGIVTTDWSAALQAGAYAGLSTLLLCLIGGALPTGPGPSLLSQETLTSRKNGA